MKTEMNELGNLKKFERLMLKEVLNLTGCEVSINNFKKGQSYPFIHSHKKNEEVFLFTKGKGLFWIDGEVIPVKEGSVFRLSPSVKRGLKAEEDLQFICIQAEENTLTQSTREDGILCEEKAPWHE